MKKTGIALSIATALLALPLAAFGRTLIQNKGSDTLVHVAQAWAEEYQKVKPDVAIAVTGGGSGTGIASLLNGTVDLANASRAIKANEIEKAKKNGIVPKEYTIGFDALAVFVHKDNPMNHISIPKLAEMYGEGGKTVKWSDLGITVPGCKDNQIILISRQNNSGTYVYFQEAVLGEKREVKLGTKDMHDSKDVVDLVEKTPCAIGYSGLAYDSPHIKKLKISKGDTDTPVEATMDNAVNKTYPIARPLFMYTNGEPKGEVKNYMDWLMGDVAQCIIKSMGYAPFKPITCKK